MAKTQEELNALKEEVVTLNEKLKELTEDELTQVTGGVLRGFEEPDFVVPGFVIDIHEHNYPLSE